MSELNKIMWTTAGVTALFVGLDGLIQYISNGNIIKSAEAGAIVGLGARIMNKLYLNDKKSYQI